MAVRFCELGFYETHNKCHVVLYATQVTNPFPNPIFSVPQLAYASRGMCSWSICRTRQRNSSAAGQLIREGNIGSRTEMAGRASHQRMGLMLPWVDVSDRDFFIVQFDCWLLQADYPSEGPDELSVYADR